MNGLFQAAKEIQQTLEAQKWPFCFIGGLAVIRWGEVRMTQDIDLCLMCGFGNEEAYAKQLLNQYKSRIDDPLTFALDNRVLLLFASNGVAMDISLSGLPFEEEMIRNATPFLFSSDCPLITCSAEDLIVLKAFADRPKDWGDVESIATRYMHKLNRNYIIEQLTPLCDLKESPEIITKLDKVLTSEDSDQS